MGLFLLAPAPALAHNAVHTRLFLEYQLELFQDQLEVA